MNSGTSTKLRFFNTATKTKQDFVPLDASNVRLYVCGPTVYDYAHIGNARPAIVFDVLFRLLRHVYGPEHVTYVRNITDVDDKINARAVRDFPDLPLNEAIGKLTEKTETQYQKDMAALGCLDPTLQPRATAHIDEMIEMIQVLIEKKNAYPKDGHVLFSVKSYEKYGALARRTLSDMIAGARVEVASYKRDEMDFVLWKPSADNEPGWKSPWGRGRPGWHIECSAMSKKLLGETFDIHGGGIDLSFPHHENELAQSCCANDTELMAQIWMHNGFLQVEGQKMSKSEGNFFTVDELLNTTKFGGRKWPGQVLRLAMLMTHYRKPIDFSIARLEEAAIELSKLKNAVGFLNLNPDIGPSDEFVAALKNDLDTPGVIAGLSSLRRKIMNDDRMQAEQASRRSELIDERSSLEIYQLLAALDRLGIDIDDYDRDWLRKQRSATEIDETSVEEKIASRLTAIADKDWAKADKIRADLLEQGIQLMDYKDPETGERKTKWEVKQ